MVLIQIFRIKTMVSITSKTEIETKTKHGKIMDKLIDMPLLEQVGFGVVFGQNKPMMLVFAVLLRRLWPWHHQRASKSQVVDDRPSLKGILTSDILRIDGLAVSCQGCPPLAKS